MGRVTPGLPSVSVTPSSQERVGYGPPAVRTHTGTAEQARAGGPRDPSGHAGGLSDPQFSLSSLAPYTKLLPVFNEKQPDDFFVTFERTVTIAGRLRHTWPLLLHHRLVSKAQSAKTALSDEEARGYDVCESKGTRSLRLGARSLEKKVPRAKIKGRADPFRVALTH